MQNEKRRINNDKAPSAFCILHSAFCIAPSHCRRGGVYIAVLGTSLIVALLGLAAILGQRIQNRMLTASADIRQAELNAQAAVELGLLTMRQMPNWRTTLPQGRWFTDRPTGAGTCSLAVIDPLDGDFANNTTDAVVVRGIGYRGDAEQRVELLIDTHTQALSCLRSAIAAGGTIDLQSDTLRTGGLVTATQISATSSNVYGTVEAASISGSTYHGTTRQISAASLPAMPDWTTVFDYYRNIGTEITIGSLPTEPTSSFARNPSIENGANDWTGTPPSTSNAQISQSNAHVRTGSNSLRVQNRTDWRAGAAQRIEQFVKPGHAYNVEVYVMLPVLSLTHNFRLSLHTKGTADASAQATSTDLAVLNILSLSWARISGTLTAPPWSGDLDYAFVKVAGAGSGDTAEFYVDDLTIRDTATGLFIYRRALGPGTNPFGAANPLGVYWINCGGNRLTIERSRIVGTLLVINPGAGSRIAHGPINWAPAVAGYPALLVDATTPANANFALEASNRMLSEAEQRLNFNPTGAAHEQLGTDTDTDDIYQSSIRGAVIIRNDLSYAHRTLVRGQVIVGRNIANSSGELDVEYSSESLLNPPPGFAAPYSYVRRPASTRKAVLP